jgi:hypothetical protein
MSEITDLRRRIYGPLYWVPVPAGLLATFYAGTCFQGYWDTGKVALLALEIFASSLGTTLVTAGVRSYAVAAVNGVFTVLNVIVVARSGQWPLMYLPFMSAVFAVTAGLLRRRRGQTLGQ